MRSPSPRSPDRPEAPPPAGPSPHRRSAPPDHEPRPTELLGALAQDPARPVGVVVVERVAGIGQLKASVPAAGASQQPGVSAGTGHQLAFGQRRRPPAGAGAIA